MLPFTHEEFLQVFAGYNQAIWPAQVIAYLVGLAMLAALARGSSRLAALGLALMWLWTGVGYHWFSFTRINPAAWAFGALFVLQAMLITAYGVFSSRLRLDMRGGGAVGALGWFLIVYAALLYPLLGVLTGHSYPRMPMFGVTPCPVTLFTFGLFLLASARVPRWLLVIPAAWSLVGGSAAFLLGVPQDWLLLFSGLAIVPIVLRDRRPLGTALA